MRNSVKQLEECMEAGGVTEALIKEICLQVSIVKAPIKMWVCGPLPYSTRQSKELLSEINQNVLTFLDNKSK